MSTEVTLRGRTAIVVGAGCGAGAAAARALGRAGASVVLAACAGPDLEVLAAEIGSAGGHAVAVPMDIANPVSVQRLVEQTLGAFGRLDVAFNAAEVPLAMRYEVPSMRRAGGGHIVNLALTPAVLDVTRAAAVDLAGSGVRINAVRADDLADWLSTVDGPAPSTVTGWRHSSPARRPTTRLTRKRSGT